MKGETHSATTHTDPALPQYPHSKSTQPNLADQQSPSLPPSLPPCDLIPPARRGSCMPAVGACNLPSCLLPTATEPFSTLSTNFSCGIAGSTHALRDHLSVQELPLREGKRGVVRLISLFVAEQCLRGEDSPALDTLQPHPAADAASLFSCPTSTANAGWAGRSMVRRWRG